MIQRGVAFEPSIPSDGADSSLFCLFSRFFRPGHSRISAAPSGGNLYRSVSGVSLDTHASAGRFHVVQKTFSKTGGAR